MIKRLILQAYLFALWLYNIALSAVLLFTFRRAILRLVGNKIGKKVAIHRCVTVRSFQGLEIGDGTVVNYHTLLDARRKIKIGRHVNIAHDVAIYTLGHDIDTGDFRSSGSSVEIGDYCVIFAKVIIMPGVKLNKGAVVYPGAVVCRSVGEFEVVGGNPAKFIRMRERNLGYKLSYEFWFGH